MYLRKSQVALGAAAIMSALIMALSGCQQSPARSYTIEDWQSPYHQQIDSIISTLNLKQKVGQMTQLNLDVISVGEVYNLQEPHQLDTAKMRKALLDYQVGSILNVGGHGYSLEHWRQMTDAIQDMALQSASGIPVLYGIDAIHGANYVLDAQLFPQPIAQAATWNPSLARQVAEMTAFQTRASGVPWNFSPVLDLARQPLWSRVFETYGEDVHLAKTMGSATVQGYQGDDPAHPHRVAACMKHFVGYSMPYSGKDRTPVYMGEGTLRRYFLPTFQAATDAGALTVMINSGEINGVPVHADSKMLQDLLRKDLDFHGLAVTDWEDIMKLESPHRVAANLKEAVAMAINAGIDMSMVPNDYDFSDLLVELVEEGAVSMQRIDESVYRILHVKYALGLFDQARAYPMDQYPDFGREKAQSVAYQTAAEALTLLKNENDFWPLHSEEEVLFVGPGLGSKILLNGAWSRTWQGTDPQFDRSEQLTVQEALAEHSGAYSFFPVDTALTTKQKSALQQAIAKAPKVIYLLAEQPSTEIPGNIDDLNLVAWQKELVQLAQRQQKEYGMVLLFNRTRIITEEAKDASGILLAYQPGEEGAEAIRDVLTGQVNPSGKLPLTYPKAVNDFSFYDRKHTEDMAADFSMTGHDPLFAFGHGLSYTSFAYQDLQLSGDTLYGDTATLRVSVRLKNTGARPGKEVLQLYVNDMVASITPSVKKLRAFEKVSLEAGQEQEFSFSLPVQELSFIDRDMAETLEAGEFTVELGNQSQSFYLKL